MTHDYKRHGTTTLFAALNMATGEVIGKTYRKHRHRELLRFLREVVRIPVQLDHRFRRKSITDSDSTRSLIPAEADHRFRCQADHFSAMTGIVHGVRCEGARARGESGSPGARAAHRAHDLGRTGKSCRAAGIEPRTRSALLMAAQPLAVQVGVAPACQALGVSRATFHRRQRPTPGHQQPRPTPARALCDSEREHVLNVLASRRFVDRDDHAEVAATLLDEGQYLCSERTMYRHPGRESAGDESGVNQRDHPPATPVPRAGGHGALNQTWSWDITKLLRRSRSKWSVLLPATSYS